MTEIPSNDTFTHEIEGNHTSLVVYSLHPYYEYHCTVAAVTVRMGVYSFPLTLRTHEDGEVKFEVTRLVVSISSRFVFITSTAPSGSPVALAVVELGSSYIQFSWQPPLPEQQNGVIEHYTINITEINTGIQTQLISSVPQVNVTSLHPFYNYDCAVSAFTVKAGPYTEIITAVTLEASKRTYSQSESLHVV